MTERKGKLLINANHVCNVKERRKDGLRFIIIEVLVIKQTSVTS